MYILHDMYILPEAHSVAAAAVIGETFITLPAPIRKSEITVVAALGVTVNAPVLFVLPSITPRMTLFCFRWSSSFGDTVKNVKIYPAVL